MRSMIPLLLLSAICVTSCTKYPDAHPHQIPLQVLSFTPTSSHDTSYIAYNSRGNPVTITQPGNDIWYFLYDNKGRVTDYYHPYHNQYFDVWHRFKYDHLNRVITDSIYEFGITGPQVPLPDENGRLRVWKVSQFTYDAKNRIIKALDAFGEAYNGDYEAVDTAYSRYTYNAAGNLAGIWSQYESYEPDTANLTYDNKVSINSLHPIWQLLSRDYSVNNSYSASSFNQWGLPLELNFSSHTFGQFANFTLPASSIVYGHY